MRVSNRQQTFRERLLEAVMLNDAILPAFQPIVDLSHGNISSLEVLARWEDSKVGIVNPSEFIPLVEQAGLLDHMTDRLMIKSCTRAANWGGDFRLSFNLSHRQFFSMELAPRISRIASDARFPIDRLQVEIAEDDALDDLDQVSFYTKNLKNIGVRTLLDDFGNNGVRVDRLRSIPFDKIKIDRKFIQSIENHSDIKKTTLELIELGRSLGMSIVAEGIESVRQFKIIKRLGFDYGQGYYFGKPMFHDLVPSFLASCRPSARSKAMSAHQFGGIGSSDGSAASHGP